MILILPLFQDLRCQEKTVELQSTYQNLILLGKKQYPFVNKVQTDKHSFYCTICKRNIKCGNMGLSHVQWHISTSMHQRYARYKITENSCLSVIIRGGSRVFHQWFPTMLPRRHHGWR